MFPKRMAFSSPIMFYLVLKGVSLLMPFSAFRLAFTNGLMSEAMFLWFLSMLLWSTKRVPECDKDYEMKSERGV